MAHNFAQAVNDWNVIWTNSRSFGSTTPFTINAWFKTTATGSGAVTITSLYAGSIINGHTLRINLSTGRINARTADGTGTSQAASTTGWTTGTWHMATGVWTSATSRTAYVNGGSSGTNTVSRIPATITDWVVASSLPEEEVAEYEGELAEIAIWEAALTADEIVSLYRGFKATQVRPESLIVYLPMMRETVDVCGPVPNVPFVPSVVTTHPSRIG